ncbi:family 20 glycosylhydrolase [Robertkochia sediminum]|uniref:family 20 glycosylhydrolase n=1 Tax=Robertkochia sediminum TaxID=2785326 RepID=UPI001933AD32|nr:family 20 glycosylhydrolase [Robertkochia sediminum]MBL7473259.1 beta-N-acetylhexosaminidase [Robertkochia sediminum]
MKCSVSDGLRVRWGLFSLFFLLVLFFLVTGCSVTTPDSGLEKAYPVIPTPQQAVYSEEELFFDSFMLDAGGFQKEGAQLEAFFQQQNLTPSNGGMKIELRQKEGVANGNKEGYELTIDERVRITAATSQGAFYGIQTLKQLFRSKQGKGVLPQIAITDWPAFAVRGFMHDTGRNFQSLDLLKEQLELMALYKYNVFHWHLTDNPGWRLESKRYPELQSPEATSRKKGKFYSHEDFKEVLAYCKARHITVIPELDIPGHTEAFRKAFGFENMTHPRVKPVLLDLFAELMSLADPEEMPFVHIGTDEVKMGKEQVAEDVILDIMNLIKDDGREVVVWKQGITIPRDSTSISQLWASHPPREGHRFIDSRSNYVNHLDPFAGMSRLYFQQPCRQPVGDEVALGGILCAWPDNAIGPERDVLKQNPVYPSMLFYADAIWKGRQEDKPEFWAQLPNPSTPEFASFEAFEEKVLVHRDHFFKDKEFPYIKQTGTRWKVIGPFDHGGDVQGYFPVEEIIDEEYTVDRETYRWKDSIVGATIHLKHFFGFPALTEKKEGTYYAYTNVYAPEDRVQDFWIGFQGWSRSGRRGGPTPDLGQWHTTNPKVWVNGKEIEPPVWKQPNLGADTGEIPFVDEDYFYREPTKVPLKKGWNTVLLKIPHGGTSWKWMFTCIPVSVDGENVKEVTDLQFNTRLKPTKTDKQTDGSK